MHAKRITTETVMAQDGTTVFFDRYSSGHKEVIVIAHGFFNSKDSILLKDFAEELNHQFDCIIMDFRGHGQTEGLFYWTTKEYLDLVAVLEKARGEYQKVGVIGFSLGAATSIITAAKYKLMDSLVAVSAPVSFDEIEFHFWDLDVENDIIYNVIGDGKVGKGVRPGPFWMAKEKPKAVVGNIKIPVYYIHGQQDWLIKPWHSQELFDRTKALRKISIIADGPHAEYLIRKNRQEFITLSKDWFMKTFEPGLSKDLT